MLAEEYGKFLASIGKLVNRTTGSSVDDTLMGSMFVEFLLLLFVLITIFYAIVCSRCLKDNSKEDKTSLSNLLKEFETQVKNKIDETDDPREKVALRSITVGSHLGQNISSQKDLEYALKNIKRPVWQAIKQYEETWVKYTGDNQHEILDLGDGRIKEIQVTYIHEKGTLLVRNEEVKVGDYVVKDQTGKLKVFREVTKD